MWEPVIPNAALQQEDKNSFVTYEATQKKSSKHEFKILNNTFAVKRAQTLKTLKEDESE